MQQSPNDSDAGQIRLRQKVRELAAALAARDIDAAGMERAFEHLRAFDSRLYSAGEKRPGSASTFYRLFGFKGNERKYLGALNMAPRLKLSATHIACIHRALNAMGFAVSDPLDRATPMEWEAFVELAIAVCRAPTRTTRPVLIPHPVWRFVERPKVVTELQRRLDATGVAAVVGMSGIGKSIVARQVAEAVRAAGGAVFEFDATPYVERGVSVDKLPTAANYVGLWQQVLSAVIGMGDTGPHSLDKRTEFKERLQEFVQNWSNLTNGLTTGEKRFYDAVSKERPGDEAKDDDLPSWREVRRAFGAHGAGFRNARLMTDIAEIIRSVSGDALIVLDGVLNIAEARTTVAALFGRSRRNGTRSPLRLLLTSKRRSDDLAFLAERSTDAMCFADLDDSDPEFARQVVAAWSAPGQEDLERAEAETGIAAFRAAKIENDPETGAAIDHVVAQVGGHALALAALASAWREWGHPRGFWRRASETIQSRPEELLRLDACRDSRGVISERHTNVLQALRMTWELLGRDADWLATHDRFLDLTITPPGETLDELVLLEFWKRTPRGPKQEALPPAIAAARSPLRLMAAASFVRPLGATVGAYYLHDMHRVLIQWELGEVEAQAARHRDFLRAFGLLDCSGKLFLDQEQHFRVDNERTILWPRLGANADEADVRDVGRYLIRNLPHHAASTANADNSALIATLATFRFLQARLDVHEGAVDPPAKTGNVEFLLSAFDHAATEPLGLLAQTIRLAGQALAIDKSQLAAQLLARLPIRGQSRLDQLKHDAASYGFRPMLAAATPFLEQGGHGVICHIKSSGGFDGAQWLDQAPGGPAILSWSGTVIALWNPASGYARIAMDHGDRVGGAMLIADAANGPLILSWSWGNGTIRLWSAKTGELQTSVAECGWIDGAALIGEMTGGPAIMSWSHADTTVRFWDAATGNERRRLQHCSRPERRPWDDFGANWIADAAEGHKVISWSGRDNSICVWNPDTGEELNRIPMNVDIGGARWVAMRAARRQSSAGTSMARYACGIRQREKTVSPHDWRMIRTLARRARFRDQKRPGSPMASQAQQC